MGSTFPIRPITTAEQAPVADLTAAVYLGEGFVDPAEDAYLRDVASRVATATVLVAVDHVDSALLGTITVATRLGPWASQASDGEAVVRLLAVPPSARGRGVGMALVRAAVEAARHDGCRLVRLSTQDDMLAAMRLYERAGFLRTPEDDWCWRGEVPLRAYVLPL